MVHPATPGTPGAPDRASGLSNLGFLTVLNDANGYVGGYLVTNTWGRPLEFRLSSAVQPNRVQQILYGGTLQPYICADLIGKTLVERAGVPVQFVVTDREQVLDLRLKLDVPVLWLAPADEAGAGERGQARGAADGSPEGVPPASATGSTVWPPSPGRGPVLCHPRFPGDAALARALLARLEGAFDLAEPFGRIREAIGEARKMGVHK